MHSEKNQPPAGPVFPSLYRAVPEPTLGPLLDSMYEWNESNHSGRELHSLEVSCSVVSIGGPLYVLVFRASTLIFWNGLAPEPVVLNQTDLSTLMADASFIANSNQGHCQNQYYKVWAPVQNETQDCLFSKNKQKNETCLHGVSGTFCQG